MGKKSRTKGHSFERKIAKKFREMFPELADLIRRSDQSHRANDADVTGIPGLWIECQDAQRKDSNPRKKLTQATKDSKGKGRMPVAITHVTGTKTIQASMGTRNYVAIVKLTRGDTTSLPELLGPSSFDDVMVTIDFEDFLLIYRAAQP